MNRKFVRSPPREWRRQVYSVAGNRDVFDPFATLQTPLEGVELGSPAVAKTETCGTGRPS